MATKKETATTEVVTEEVKEKKTSRKAKKESVVIKSTKATIHDFDIILEPVITEKSMSSTQNDNKFTFIVKKSCNKTEIRNAIEKIYDVHVVGISTINVNAKATSRGSRFKGKLPGYKKAVVSLKEGETINLFAE